MTSAPTSIVEPERTSMQQQYAPQRPTKSTATALGQLAAAKDVLAVSQRELTRIKTQGYDMINEEDRLFRRTPNYKSMPWPVITGPSILQTYDPNSMGNGRESVHAEAFTAPWQSVGKGTGQAKPLYHTPGTSFAPSSDLNQMYEANYNSGTNDDDPPEIGSALGNASSMFKINTMDPDDAVIASMVQSIKHGIDEQGMASPLPDNPSSFARFEGYTGDKGTAIESMTLPAEPAQTLYGDANTHRWRNDNNMQVPGMDLLSKESLASDVSMPGDKKKPVPVPPALLERFRLCMSGMLYDALHYNDITMDDVQSNNCQSKLSYILTRDNRLPYVGLMVVSFLFLLLAFFAFL